MRRALFLILMSGAIAPSLPAQSETLNTNAAGEAASIRDCRPPAEAKEAQVLAFDKDTLEAKLAVTLDKGEFKVMTVKIWERPKDPRPLVPVIEAARITQGKLHVFTPNLNADPEPVHAKQILLSASLGGSQVCWATESAMLQQGAPPKPIAEVDLRSRTR